MWWPWVKRRPDRREEIRQERGRLAVAVVDLDRKRHNVEQLMKRMLEERSRGLS